MPRAAPLPLTADRSGHATRREPLRMAKAPLLPLPRYWIIGPLKDLFENVPPAQWTAVQKAYLRGIADAEACR